MLANSGNKNCTGIIQLDMQRHGLGEQRPAEASMAASAVSAGPLHHTALLLRGRDAGQRLCEVDLRFTQCKGTTAGGTFDICSLTAEVILGGGLLKLRWLRSLVFTTVSMRSLPPCRFLLWDLLLERSDLLLWVWNTRNKDSGRLVTRPVRQSWSEHSWQSECQTYLAWVTDTICVSA